MSEVLTPCIEWQGHRGSNGYGTKGIRGKNYKAHRLAYCEHHGLSLEDIRGVVIRHKCDNPPCVNPEHLEPGTHADNAHDRDSRGRHVPHYGEENGCSKLTEDQVRAIHRQFVSHSRTLGATALARKYGVSRITVNMILHGQRWKSIYDEMQREREKDDALKQRAKDARDEDALLNAGIW